MKWLELAVGPGLCLLLSAQTASPLATNSAPLTLAPQSALQPESPSPLGPAETRRWGLVEGLNQMRELYSSGQSEEALALGNGLLAAGRFCAWRRELEREGESWWLPVLEVADPLFDILRLNGLTRKERAHVHYALGVVAQAMPPAPAAPAAPAAPPQPASSKVARFEFGEARARAGVGDLRAAATYNLGCLALAEGEGWRSQMPEFGGTPSAPSAPGPMTGPAPSNPGEEPPDPLEQARLHYLEAKQRFVLRLRMDWNDADTRANTELVMRRLHELDDIERQREEQEQKQQQEGDPDQKDGDPKQQDPKDEPPQDQENSQEEDSQDQEQPSEEESPPDEQDAEQDPQESDESPQDSEAQETEGQESEAPQEIYLTKEEVQRLLERLKNYEKEAQELRERRRSARRPTARDW